MLKRIVLAKDTVDTLLQFGDIDTVVNNILSLVEKGDLDASNLPTAANYNSTTKITIHITNKWYIENYEYNPFSLKRLLQYFVDNELFNEYNWHIVRHRRNDAFIALSYAQKYIVDCAKLSTSHCEEITSIANMISDLCEVMRNECIVQD